MGAKTASSVGDWAKRVVAAAKRRVVARRRLGMGPMLMQKGRKFDGFRP
jgi:hypothetical protein